jgi:hypothetical protein
VRQADGSATPLFSDVRLSRGPEGLWTGRLPFLPRNKPLSFVATASNSSGSALFRGSTEQTVVSEGRAAWVGVCPKSKRGSGRGPDRGFRVEWHLPRAP